MNDKLLLRRRINFPLQHIHFLNFIHPNFEIVQSLNEYDNPNPIGIIFTGKCEDATIETLDRITANWIIVNSYSYELDLSTNEGLVKNLLPLHYIKLKSDLKNGSMFVFNTMDYGALLEKVKLCLLDCNYTL